MNGIRTELGVFQPGSIYIMDAVHRSPAVAGKACDYHGTGHTQHVLHAVEFRTDVPAEHRTGFIKISVAGQLLQKPGGLCDLVRRCPGSSKRLSVSIMMASSSSHSPFKSHRKEGSAEKQRCGSPPFGT